MPLNCILSDITFLASFAYNLNYALSAAKTFNSTSLKLQNIGKVLYGYSLNDLFAPSINYKFNNIVCKNNSKNIGQPLQGLFSKYGAIETGKRPSGFNEGKVE